MSLAEAAARAGARGVRRRRSRATHRADLGAAAGVPERDNEAELDFWADYLDWSSSGAPVPALVDALDVVSRAPTRDANPSPCCSGATFGSAT